MAECLNMGDSTPYQPILGLQDIKTTADLKQDSVRDILRASTGDGELVVESMGALEDMSGLNDAFNSSICSLQVTASFTKKSAAGDDSSDSIEKVSKTFDFVIKSPPKASFIRLMHKITKPFYNEVTWYLDLSRQLEYLNDSDEMEFKMSSLVPVCYHAYSNYYAGEATNTCESCPLLCWLPIRKSEQGILVLENVKKRGFKMHNKMQILPLDHVLLVMKNLAHFHGAWLKWRWAAEAGKLKAGAWSLDRWKNTLNTQRRVPKFIYKQLLSGAADLVDKILKGKGDEEANIAKCRTFFRGEATRQLDILMGVRTGKIDTCCHGDFWSNNILFSYDDEEKVNEIMLVDFQLLSFGHPAYDVIYVMYLSLDRDFRKAHMSTCLQQYWDILNSYIVKNAPADLTYTREEFDEDFKIYQKIGFVLASTVLPNVLSDTQVEAGGLLALRDLQRKQALELEDDTKETTKEIKRRIVGIVQDLADEELI